MVVPRERWASRIGLVLAMAGNAVGLGNFLRFPAQAAQNGGGAFLVPYLVSFLLMGLPLLFVEWAIGRHGGRYGHHSAPGLFHRLGEARWLKYVGVFGLFTNLAVAAYYCYIESWTLAYVFHSVAGTFAKADPKAFFTSYLGAGPGALAAFPGEALLWFGVTLALNVAILSRGIAKGIERAAKVGMPLLILFAAVLLVRGLTLSPGHEGVVESPFVGLNFVWHPDLSGLTNPSVWLAAAGQIFFTLSVGMGSIHCYASYLGRDEDVALNAASAGWLNEFVEVVLGGAILIPIATAYLGLAAVQEATKGGSGFGLAFLTLPTLFQNWGWFAPVAGALWFGLLFFAGITSSLAMGQPVLAFLEDELGVERTRAALLFGGATLALGLFCVVLYPGGAFDEFDFWTGTVALVVFALVETFLFTRVFGMERGWEEITRGADIRLPNLLRFVLRYVTPVFLLAVFAAALVHPERGAWGEALRSLGTGNGWPFAADSVVGKLLHKGQVHAWFRDGRPTVMLVQDATRLLLTAVFVALLVLVHRAFKRKEAKA